MLRGMTEDQSRRYLAWKERLFFQDPTVCRYIHRDPGLGRNLDAMKLVSVPPMSSAGLHASPKRSLPEQLSHLCGHAWRSAP